MINILWSSKMNCSIFFVLENQDKINESQCLKNLYHFTGILGSYTQKVLRYRDVIKGGC